MNSKEALNAINSLLKKLSEHESNLLGQACEIADKAGVQFSHGDYGSGMTYYPKGTPENELRWSNYYEGFEDGKSSEGYWMSSSEQC